MSPGAFWFVVAFYCCFTPEIKMRAILMRAACGVFVSLHRGVVSANLTVAFWAILASLCLLCKPATNTSDTEGQDSSEQREQRARRSWKWKMIYKIGFYIQHSSSFHRCAWGHGAVMFTFWNDLLISVRHLFKLIRILWNVHIGLMCMKSGTQKENDRLMIDSFSFEYLNQ